MSNIPPKKPGQRRRYSLWTLLAPAALVVVNVMSFNAVGRSGVLDSDSEKSSKTDSTTTSSAATTKKVPTNSKGRPKVRHQVAEGETAQSIAEMYLLTVDQLIGCNPQLSDPQNLQIGQYLHVDPKRCKDAADDGVI
jgi:LysM repeat protein